MVVEFKLVSDNKLHMIIDNCVYTEEEHFLTCIRNHMIRKSRDG
jgi:hypothetical protein